MLMQEATVLLLGQLLCLEAAAIDEFTLSEDGLEFMISLEWDILHSDQIDLHWIELLAIEV